MSFDWQHIYNCCFLFVYGYGSMCYRYLVSDTSSPFSYAMTSAITDFCYMIFIKIAPIWPSSLPIHVHNLRCLSLSHLSGTVAYGNMLWAMWDSHFETGGWAGGGGVYFTHATLIMIYPSPFYLSHVPRVDVEYLEYLWNFENTLIFPFPWLQCSFQIPQPQ